MSVTCGEAFKNWLVKANERLVLVARVTFALTSTISSSPLFWTDFAIIVDLLDSVPVRSHPYKKFYAQNNYHAAKSFLRTPLLAHLPLRALIKSNVVQKQN